MFFNAEDTLWLTGAKEYLELIYWNLHVDPTKSQSSNWYK